MVIKNNNNSKIKQMNFYIIGDSEDGYVKN